MYMHSLMRGRQHRRILFAVTLVVTFFTAHFRSEAQSIQGAILGTVKDPKGAVVTGATVTLTNVNDGTVRTTKTDSQGGYLFEDAKASRYTLEITATNFSKWTETNFELTARQQLRVDAILTVGGAAQTVEVSGENASAIETETPSITASFSSEEVLNLPANFRASSSGTSAISLFGTLPGVQMADSQHFSLQGALAWQTEATVDGITIQATDANTPRGDQLPSADMIAEIRADGVLNNAEFGQPGEMSIITKSGSNHLHGAAYWYHQNEDFDAITFGSATKPHKVGNTFGANLSGPVVIPHIINGHDRFFFYGGYEGFRYPQQTTQTFVVPTAAMKNGDFSGYSSTIYNGLRDPFTGASWGNHVPANQISSIAQQFLQFYPDPNHEATANGATVDTNHFVVGQTPNYYVNKDTSQHSDAYDIRPDLYLGSNQKILIWGKYTHKSYPSIYPWPVGVPSSQTVAPNDSLATSFNWTIQPNLINEARFGFIRLLFAHQHPFDGVGFLNDLGFQGLDFDPWYNGISTLSFSNISSESEDAGRMDLSFFVRQFVYADNLSWTHGTHNFKFGVEFRKALDVSPPNGNNYPYFYFSDTGNGHGMFTGVDFADFLIGTPYQTNLDTIGTANRGETLQQNYYAQDQWRVTPRLTISYGLRYEYYPAYEEVNGNLGTFDPTVAMSGRAIYPDGKQNLLAQPLLVNLNACNPDGVNNTNDATVNGVPCMPVVTNSQAGLPSGLRRTSSLRFMPRFGVAYRLTDDGKWVVRAGVGLYNINTLGIIFNQMLGSLQGNDQNYYNTYNPGTANPVGFRWPQVTAGPAQVAAPSYGTSGVQGVDVVKWMDPYTEQWTASVDHDFGHGYGARVSYIGSASRHLGWDPQWNVMPFSTTTSAYNQPITARPFPNIGTVRLVEPTANQSYNSLQVEVSHRFQRGLEFNSSFTWAKSLADNLGPDTSWENENGAGSSIIGDRHSGFGNVAGTRKLLWKTTALVDLPVGRGRAFGANMPRALDAIIGGWRLTNVFTWQSGIYLTPMLSGGAGDPSGTGASLSRAADGYSLPGLGIKPDVVPGVSWRAQHQDRNSWLNPAAFTCPGDPNWQPGYTCTTGNAGYTVTFNGQTYTGYEVINGNLYPVPGPIGRFGNEEIGHIVGPQYINLDSGIVKSFSLGERFKLRAEGTFTNVLNHTNLLGSALNTNLSSASFGTITAGYPGRVGQVSLRIDF